MDRFDDMRMKGINTNDATAVASDILEGKTAYASGQKLIGTLKQGGGGGSSGYNVFVQQSEPESKDGVWIKSNGGSNNVYFSQNMTAKGKFVDNSNFTYLIDNNNFLAQIIVGNYLYCIGEDTNSSYIYNLRTKQKIGNMNLPSDIIIKTCYAFEYEENIYIVACASSGSSTSWYSFVYHTDTKSSDSLTNFWRINGIGEYYFLAGIYENYIYIYQSSNRTQNYAIKWNLDTNKFESTASFGTNINSNGIDYRYCTSIGNKMYVLSPANVASTSGKTCLYIHTFGSGGNTSLDIGLPRNKSYTMYATGNYIYIFIMKSSSKIYYKYDIEKSELKELSVESSYYISAQYSVGSGYRTPCSNTAPLVYDSYSGLLYFHTTQQIFVMQFENSPLNSELDDGTVVITESFNKLPVLIENSSNLAIGIGSVGIIVTENAEKIINDNFVHFYGNGENWRVISNPNGETATVSFNTNGGTSVEPIEVVIGQKLLTKPETTRSGNYIFEAWYLGDEPFDFNTEIIKDITLTAHWLAYEEVDYIESSGTQYVDTGVKPNQNTKVLAKYETSVFDGTQCVIGCWANGVKNRFQYHHSNVYMMGFGDVYDNTINSDNTIVSHTIEIENGRFKLDGNLLKELTSSSSGFDDTAINIYMFACHTPNGADNYSNKLKIFNCQIYDNGTLVRNFQPIKIETGEYALVDKVNNKAYRNAGTGEFVAGEEV